MFEQDKFGGQVVHLLLKFLTAPVGLNHFVFLVFHPFERPIAKLQLGGDNFILPKINVRPSKTQLDREGDSVRV